MALSREPGGGPCRKEVLVQVSLKETSKINGFSESCPSLVSEPIIKQRAVSPPIGTTREVGGPLSIDWCGVSCGGRR